jgi:hypothetical protein
VCGVHDGYSLKDLVRPDPARVRRNLSAVINFHKFREERLATYQKYTDKTVRADSWAKSCQGSDDLLHCRGYIAEAGTPVCSLITPSHHPQSPLPMLLPTG